MDKISTERKDAAQWRANVKAARPEPAEPSSSGASRPSGAKAPKKLNMSNFKQYLPSQTGIY
eukprot:2777010-Lingulodinium_polyedra.AAC.1